MPKKLCNHCKSINPSVAPTCHNCGKILPGSMDPDAADDFGMPPPYKEPDKGINGRDLSEREGGNDGPSLMAEFLGSKFAVKTRSFLNPYAAHVVFMTRMTGSSRTTAAFFAEKLQRTITRRPVEDLINKVRRGEIVITREQLAAVAREHPMAKQYAESNPEILDPATAVGKPAKKTVAKESITEKTTAKKAARGKKATKKPPTKKPVVKKAVMKKVMVKKAAKKSGKGFPHLRGDGPPGRPPRDPGPEFPGFDSRDT